LELGVSKHFGLVVGREMVVNTLSIKLNIFNAEGRRGKRRVSQRRGRREGRRGVI
jgi:hypothetical protein